MKLPLRHLVASLALAAAACGGEASEPDVSSDRAPLRHALLTGVASIRLIAYRRPPDPPTRKGTVSEPAKVQRVLGALHRLANDEALPDCERRESYDGFVLLDDRDKEVGRVVMECGPRHGELWSDEGEPVKLRIDSAAMRAFDAP